jgi:uncharacterized membrane protein YhaH (DUF805 family)
MSTNPFSFKGRMGRAQFWLTLFGLGVLDMINPIPVEGHDITRNPPGGEVSAWYFTPVEPITAQSWLFFALYAVWVLLLLWLIAAAVVQRLNDLGITWKWAAAFFAGFVAVLVLELGVAGPGKGFSVIDIVALIVGLPVAAVGGYGMYMIMLASGYVSRHDSMPDNDLRKPIM